MKIMKTWKLWWHENYDDMKIMITWKVWKHENYDDTEQAESGTAEAPPSLGSSSESKVKTSEISALTLAPQIFF